MNISINKNSAFNQLDPKKDISNIFVPKKDINFNYTELSYQIKFGAYYISVPKKFCHLIKKTNKHYLIGFKKYYTYIIYNAQINFREKMSGIKMINKYRLIFYHYANVHKRRFEIEQIRSPYFFKFKNVEECMEAQKQIHKKHVEYNKFVLKNFGIEEEDITLVDSGFVSESEFNNNNNNNYFTNELDEEFFQKNIYLLTDNIDDHENNDDFN